MMVLAVLGGVIGVWIPTRNWPYFNLIIYPVLSVVALGVLVGIIGIVIGIVASGKKKT